MELVVNMPAGRQVTGTVAERRAGPIVKIIFSKK